MMIMGVRASSRGVATMLAYPALRTRARSDTSMFLAQFLVNRYKFLYTMSATTTTQHESIVFEVKENG